jgi:predicted Fe-Mo cluster-binding NifX family protein
MPLAKEKTSMKIALPIFGSRISPRFDYASFFLIVTVEEGKIIDRTEISVSDADCWRRIEAIRELGVESLICGGIDENSARILENHKIQLIPWIAGEVENTLKNYLKGNLTPCLGGSPGRRRKRRNCGERLFHEKKNYNRGG